MGDRTDYVVALIVVYSFAASSLAGLLQATILRRSRVGFLLLHVALLASVSGLALAVINLQWIWHPTLLSALLTVPLGIVLGSATWAWAGFLSREARTKAVQRHRQRNAWLTSAAVGSPPRMNRAVDSTLDARAAVLPGPTKWSPRRDQDYPVLALLLAAGIVEEFSYRGVLLTLAAALPAASLYIVAVLAITAAYSLTHIRLGWLAVGNSLGLGLSATVATIALHSILPGIIAHAIYNYRVWATSQWPVATGGLVYR